MIIVVDTSVWSLVFRRKRIPRDNPWVVAFQDHVAREGGIAIVGPIIQELLSGVKDPEFFKRLDTVMSPFPLLELDRSTYTAAARLANRCQESGLQPGNVDVLIAAACLEYHCPLLTADRDFLEIAKHCELVVLPPLGRSGEPG